jgi:hypothetical protein
MTLLLLLHTCMYSSSTSQKYSFPLKLTNQLIHVLSSSDADASLLQDYTDKQIQKATTATIYEQFSTLLDAALLRLSTPLILSYSSLLIEMAGMPSAQRRHSVRNQQHTQCTTQNFCKQYISQHASRRLKAMHRAALSLSTQEMLGILTTSIMSEKVLSSELTGHQLVTTLLRKHRQVKTKKD